MKISSTVGLVAIAAIVSFYAGRKSAPEPGGGQHALGENSRDRMISGPQSRVRGGRTVDIGQSAHEAAASGRNLTEEQSRALTGEERLELLRKGALIFDGLKQEAYVKEIIKTLDVDELEKAIKIFGKAQDRGNYPAQAIWNDLWKQAGRLNPEKTLSSLGPNHTRSDARFVMEGWIEANPSEAVAWAEFPKTSAHEAEAAAYALTHNANGDPEKLLAILTKRAPDDLVLKDCLQDYFDIADINGTSEGTSAIYDNLPESLKPQAWSVTMRRLSYTDAQEAVDWLGEHVKDPGADYSQSTRLFQELASDDPSGVTKWASSLPTLAGNSAHPVQMTFSRWRRMDSKAAVEWLGQVESTEPWAVILKAQYLPRK